MDAWLSARADALAAEAGIDRASLDLPASDATRLLDLAKVAAHESGARTNAPLLCYLVGVAHASGASVAALAEAIRPSTS